MAIGSTSYSDIAAGLNRVVEEMQQRNTLTDVLILILSVSLMICSGLTHLMALEGFDDGLNWESQILMAIIGGVYIAEVRSSLFENNFRSHGPLSSFLPMIRHLF